jgi:hypothetical protein
MPHSASVCDTPASYAVLGSGHGGWGGGGYYALRMWAFGKLKLPSSALLAETRYGLHGPGIEPWWGRDFPYQSKPDLGPTQPMGTGSFLGEGKAAGA